MNKHCSKCNTTKSIEDFALDKSHNDGHRSLCKSCINKYMKSYTDINHPEINKKRKERYYKNRNKELRKMKARRKLMGWKWDKTRREKHQKNPLPTMYQAAKTRAKRRNLPFSLCLKNLTLPLVCPALGIPLVPSSGAVSNNSPTIDRIDNSKGYTNDNVIIVSFKANTIKNMATIDDLEKILNFYKGLQNG